jgi:hypothetical protein
MASISPPVGTRNGVNVMPNLDKDVTTVTGLLDRIPSAQSGTADVSVSWSNDRPTLTNQVTAAIVTFQSTNNLPVQDCVVDPGGATLRQRNQLAGPTPVTATVVTQEVNSQT